MMEDVTDAVGAVVIAAVGLTIVMLCVAIIYTLIQAMGRG